MAATSHARRYSLGQARASAFNASKRRPWEWADDFNGILHRRTDDTCRARRHARSDARTSRAVGARPARADRRHLRSHASPPVDLFRTLQRSATHGARPAPPLQAWRADRGLGAEPARMDHARIRRRPGRHGAGHHQSRLQGQGTRICAEAIPLGRRVRRQFLPRQSDAGDGARGRPALR